MVPGAGHKMILPGIVIHYSFIIEVSMRHSRFCTTLGLLALPSSSLHAGDKSAASASASARPSAAMPLTGPGHRAEGKVGADIVSYQPGDETVRAYHAWPGRAGPFPPLRRFPRWGCR